MSAEQDDKLDKILNHLESQGEEIAKISRGVYGDPANGVDGLIKDNQDQEKRILALELEAKEQDKFRKDLKWWIGKIAAGVSVAVGLIVTIVKQRLGL